jgi:hypothetical protein
MRLVGRADDDMTSLDDDRLVADLERGLPGIDPSVEGILSPDSAPFGIAPLGPDHLEGERRELRE